MEDLNAQLIDWLDTVANVRVHGTTQRVVIEAFAEEREELQRLPEHRFNADELLGKELSLRENRRIKAALRMARLPVVKTLAGYDFSFQPSLDRNRILALAGLDFIERAEVVHLLGPPGTGKSHIATALAVEAVRAGKAVYFIPLADLIAQLAKAERDLEFTNVRAPVDGTFSNRLVNTGDYINVGQRLGNVVPLDGVFIDANYKETQLKRIRPGQRVTIKVDAYGFRKFTGVVDSISPAAGSVFTLLPPDNATGNFTKIVQRLPVRIRVPNSVAKQGMLRAGMSVYTTVDTREGAADADADTDLDAPMMIHPQ